METARPAQHDDRPACTVLLTKALDAVRTVRGGRALVGNVLADELLARWTAGSPRETALYVGEFDSVVVGLAAATTRKRVHTDERSGPSGRIECCYVEEGARGVGVGTALMTSLVTWCTEQGCPDMDALALPGDRHSKQRFEAAGFTARLLVLNRPLN